MQLTQPLYLLFLLLVPVVILLHSIIFKRKTLVVSSVFFWARALKESKSRFSLRKLLKDIPLILQILAVIFLAATLSGLCIANTGTLVPHALGYPVTVRYDLSHGRTTALLIPAFLEKMQAVEPERAEKVGELLGESENPPAAMRAFIESLGVAPRLGAYGIREKDAEPFSRLARSKKHVKNSPGEWPESVLQDVFKESI